MGHEARRNKDRYLNARTAAQRVAQQLTANGRDTSVGAFANVQLVDGGAFVEAQIYVTNEEIQGRPNP